MSGSPTNRRLSRSAAVDRISGSWAGRYRRLPGSRMKRIAMLFLPFCGGPRRLREWGARARRPHDGFRVSCGFRRATCEAVWRAGQAVMAATRRNRRSLQPRLTATRLIGTIGI